jgi:3-keto-5-aminohexanoate cleavage enzyme
MSARTPVIIEAAINGSTPVTVNPNVPRTPAQIAVCALAGLDRSAAIVHNHNDDPNPCGSAFTALKNEPGSEATEASRSTRPGRAN